MASEICLCITKYFLFLFNLISFFFGSTLLSLGLWIIFSKESFLIPELPYMSLSLFSYLLLITGSVTMLLSFCGSLGALKEVKGLLAIYFLLLTLLLAAQIIGGVLFFTQRSALERSLESHGNILIKTFKRNDSNLQDLEKTLEFIQKEAKCCGLNGKSDWPEIPCSCYYIINVTANATDQNCNCTELSKCDVYAQGCKEIITTWLDKHNLIIFAVLLSVIVLEICGLILSMYQYNHVHEYYTMTSH